MLEKKFKNRELDLKVNISEQAQIGFLADEMPILELA